MRKLKKSLSIRSESSYQLSDSSKTDRSNTNSIESYTFQAGQISDTIKQLILEQKRKNFMSKTQVSYKPNNLKRFHSVSMINIKKEAMTLPCHLQRLLHSHKKCPNIATDDLLDSIYGAFFGFLIGDIVGAHIAYKVHSLPLHIPSALLMNGGGTYNIGPAQGTDQTEILFSTCYGLIEGRGTYSQDLIALRYLKWVQSKPFNISAIFQLALNQLRKKKMKNPQLQLQNAGELLVQASVRNKNHQSNLGLVRILPIVVWSLNLDQKQFHKVIKDQLLLICPNELVIQTGLVYATMLRTIFKTRDHQQAYYEAARWVYSRGSQKLKDLWRCIQLQIEIQSPGNMGKLKTSFTYACIEINKKQVKFMDSLLKTLIKGGDTDSNCSIVMALVGSIIGYNRIPSYFKHKITYSRMSQSSRPRNQQYTPYHVIDIVQNLMKVLPNRYVKSVASETCASRMKW